MAFAQSNFNSQVTLLASDKTRRAFAQAGRGVDTLQRRFTGLSLKSAGATVALTALATAFVLGTKRAIENADAIAKQSDAIGISTDTLQEYRHAAQLSGVETEKLDNALLQFSKRIGEARADTGSLVEFLRKYDESMVDALQATNNTDEALDFVLQTMAGMENQTDRAALAAAAFGRSGVALTNIVRDGAASLAEMRREAQELGLVIPESMTREAEAANDSLTRMRDIIGVNLQKALLSLTPFIVSIGAAFAAAAPKIAQFVEEIVAAIGGIELLSIQGLKRELEEIDQELDEINQAIAADRSGKNIVADTLSFDIKRLQDAQLQTMLLIEERERDIDRINKTGDAAKRLAEEELEAYERRRAAAVTMLEGITQANLAANDNQIALVHMRVAKELEAIEAAELTLAEKRQARMLAEETAELRIAEIRAEALGATEISTQEHLDRMQQMEQAAAARNEALWRSSAAARLQIVGGALGQLSGLMQSGSKKLFAVGKAAAIAETVVSTIASAQRAYQAFAWNPPLAALMAGIAYAAGIARVRQIAATRFGGGNAPGDPGGGTPPPPTGPAAAPASVPDLDRSQAPRQPQNIFVQLPRGGMVTTDWILDEFLPVFEDVIGDGANIRINP